MVTDLGMLTDFFLLDLGEQFQAITLLETPPHEVVEDDDLNLVTQYLRQVLTSQRHAFHLGICLNSGSPH